ncbi:MAG: aminotransferase class III-fold pyridoxal phosphate-dependent enzyme, partial [Actinomycetota bacterium]
MAVAALAQPPQEGVGRDDGADPGDAVLALLDQYLDDTGSGVDTPACILLEPVQGNGGAVVPPDAFLRGLRERCDRHG